MNFGRFYQLWLQHLQLHLDQLAPALIITTTTDEDQQYLVKLIGRVLTHYHDYYRVKAHASKSSIFSMFAASWLTSLERSLHWVAGWRPTTIFHLIYTESSVRFESRLLDLLQGQRTGDLGDLSPSQLGRVSELQCQTVKEENDITAELGSWQESASDLVMFVDNEDEKIQRLVRVLAKADDLRLRTIQKVVEILTAQQTVEFLIAAAVLQFGVRGWGLDKDERRDGSDG